MWLVRSDIAWSDRASRLQIYVLEITDYVGTSGVDFDLNNAMGVVDSWTYPAGDFVDIIKPPVCPPGCTTAPILPLSSIRILMDLLFVFPFHAVGRIDSDCDKLDLDSPDQLCALLGNAVSPKGEGECTRTTCRVCPINFPECPKEFLTNCTEVGFKSCRQNNAVSFPLSAREGAVGGLSFPVFMLRTLHPAPTADGWFAWSGCREFSQDQESAQRVH